MTSGSKGESRCTGPSAAPGGAAASGAIQWPALPAPSIATGTRRRRRTRASISAAMAGLRGASRWQIEVEADDALGAQRAVEQVVEHLRARWRGAAASAQPKWRSVSS